MDFLVKLGESGVAFTYEGIPSSEKVSFLQKKIKEDAKIEIEDQLLFTKKGYQLKSTELFSTVESENNFQTTMNAHHAGPLSKAKTYTTIFVFNEKYYDDKNAGSTPYSRIKKDDFKNYVEDLSPSSLVERQKVDKVYPASFANSSGSEHLVDKIKAESKDILSVEEKFFELYKSAQNKYLDYLNKIQRTKYSLAQCENQLQSFDVISKNRFLNFKTCKARKDEFVKKFKDSIEKHSTIIKKFDVSLEALKSIELHSSLQTEKTKYLADIYYDNTAMQSWKNKCLGNQSALKDKLEKFSNYFKETKQTIKNELNTISATLPAQIKSQHEDFESFCNQDESILHSFFVKLYEEYTEIRVSLEGDHPEARKAILQKYNLEKVTQKEEGLAIFDEKNKKLENFNEGLSSTKTVYESKVATEFKAKAKSKLELVAKTQETLKSLTMALEKTVKEFTFLLSPGQLPEAYNNALSEVSRRREFKTVFEAKLKKFQALLESERDRRKRFISHYGGILPNNFITQLKHVTPQINLSYNDQDKDLPAIDGFHTDKIKQPKTGQRSKTDPALVSILEKTNLNLKEEIARDQAQISSLKSKLSELEDLLRKSESQQRMLKVQLNDSESGNQRHSDINKRDNDKRRHQSSDPEVDKFRTELESLSKILSNHLPSDDQENFGALRNLSNENKSHHSKNANHSPEKLMSKIAYLTGVVQMTTKTTYELFHKKLIDKQKLYNESMQKFENQMMKYEEDFAREKIKITTFYEEKTQTLNESLSEANRKVNTQAEDLRKKQLEIDRLKDIVQEKQTQVNSEISTLKKELVFKGDQLKNKEKQLKELNEALQAKEREYKKSLEELEAYKQKVKKDHADVLNNIHSVHRTDMEQLQAKIKEKENDLENKSIELQAAQKKKSELEFELRQKEDLNRKLNSQYDSLQTASRKTNEELISYKNKIDNLEISLAKKTTEITNLNNSLKELEREKGRLTEDLNTYKQVNSDINKKIQNMNDKSKKLEVDKEVIKSEKEEIKAQLAKREAEIANISSQLNDISKHTESQQTERNRFSDELKNKAMELNIVKTRFDLCTADLENKKKENDALNEKVISLKEELENIRCDYDLASSNLRKEKDTSQGLQEQINKLNTICEQLHIESDLMKARWTEIEAGAKQTRQKMVEKEDELNKVRNECDNSQSKLSALEKKSREDCDRLQAEISHYKKQLKERSEEMEKIQGIYRETNKELEAARERLECSLQDMQGERGLVTNLEREISEKQRKIEDLGSQEKSLQEEIVNLNSFIEQQKQTITKMEKERDNNVELVVRLNESQSVITQQLTQVEKEKLSVQKLLEDNKQLIEQERSLMALEESRKINILRVEPGNRVLFIPYAEGVYAPLNIHQYTKKEIEYLLKKEKVPFSKETFSTIETSIQNEFVLDVESLDAKTQEILRAYSLILVGKVSSITAKKDASNKMLNHISVEKLEYLVGFEEEDMLLKNYIVS